MCRDDRSFQHCLEAREFFEPGMWEANALLDRVVRSITSLQSRRWSRVLTERATLRPWSENLPANEVLRSPSHLERSVHRWPLYNACNPPTIAVKVFYRCFEERIDLRPPSSSLPHSNRSRVWRRKPSRCGGIRLTARLPSCCATSNLRAAALRSTFIIYSVI